MVSVGRALVQMGPTVDATLLLLVTRTTVTDKLSATVTRVTQVSLRSCFYSLLCLHVSCCSSSPAVFAVFLPVILKGMLVIPSLCPCVRASPVRVNFTFAFTVTTGAGGSLSAEAVTLWIPVEPVMYLNIILLHHQTAHYDPNWVIVWGLKHHNKTSSKLHA